MATAKLIPLRRNEDLMTEIERLHSMISELQDQLSMSHDVMYGNEKGVFVNADGISRFIKSTSVAMIKSDSNYSTIYLEDGTSILTSKTLKHWEEKFDCSHYLRIHHSYLVNTQSIKYIDFKNNEVIMISGSKASFSRSGKNLLKTLG